MSVVGNKPADKLLTSDDVQDGAISTNDLANLSVTPAKLSTGAPSWDVSGNLVSSGNTTSYQNDTGVSTYASLNAIKNGGASLQGIVSTVGGYLGTTNNYPVYFRTNNLDKFSIATDGSFSSVIPGGSTLYPEFKCRAWVSFVGATGVIRASGNVSSVVRNSTGNYTITFAKEMPDVNYAVFGTGQGAGGGGVLSVGPLASGIYTTTQVQIGSQIYTGASNDGTVISISILR
jgi:hypothetical protein